MWEGEYVNARVCKRVRRKKIDTNEDARDRDSGLLRYSRLGVRESTEFRVDGAPDTEGAQAERERGMLGRRKRPLGGIDARAYFERVLGVVSRARFRGGKVGLAEGYRWFVEWHSGPRTRRRPAPEILTPSVIADPLLLKIPRREYVQG